MPKWMTPAEMSKFGLNIDAAYKELISMPDLNIQENCQAYYKRSDAFVRHVLKEYPEGQYNYRIKDNNFGFAVICCLVVCRQQQN